MGFYRTGFIIMTAIAISLSVVCLLLWQDKQAQRRGIPLAGDAATLTAAKPLVELTGGKDASAPEQQTAAAVTENRNLALGKTAEASGTENDERCPNLAIDGDEETRWSSEFTDEQWLQIDLGEEYAIGRVVIHWEDASGRDFSILTSSDGKSWQVAKKIENGEGGTQEISFPPVRARHVKLDATARNTEYGYSIFEFAVYGK